MELYYPSDVAPILPFSAMEGFVSGPVACEMVPIVEANGNVIGQASREFVHGGSKLLHPVVHLHVLNRIGEIYLQKRSMKKELLPGYWDTAVGGHVVYGECIKEALIREAYEELHLYDFNPYFIDSYVFESDTERELVNVFACIGNFHLEPDQDEVEEGRFWNSREIEESFEKSVITPNFELEFLRIHKNLEALL